MNKSMMLFLLISLMISGSKTEKKMAEGMWQLINKI